MEQIPLAVLESANRMTYQEFDQWLIEQAQRMPHLRGDRALQSAATNATNQNAANANSTFAPLSAFANSWINNPPGYGTALPGMESTAGQVGNAVASGQQMQATQRAAQTGNAAGLNASQDAIAQGAARGVGQNIQDILASNQQLKTQQQQTGAGLLSGLYNTSTNAIAPEVNAGVNAGNSGWLQNLFGGINAETQLVKP